MSVSVSVWQVFDNGSNPKDDDDRRSGSSKTREELGASLHTSLLPCCPSLMSHQ